MKNLTKIDFKKVNMNFTREVDGSKKMGIDYPGIESIVDLSIKFE